MNSPKGCYVSASEPYVSVKEPCVTAKEPYTSTKEPCVPAKEPWETAKGLTYPPKSPMHQQKSSMYPSRSFCVSAIAMCPQKSPMFPQKSPVYPQKRPVYLQKSPMHLQKSPIYPQKSLLLHTSTYCARELASMSFAHMCIYKRVLYIRKRALCIRKRTLYFTHQLTVLASWPACRSRTSFFNLSAPVCLQKTIDLVGDDSICGWWLFFWQMSGLGLAGDV